MAQDILTEWGKRKHSLREGRNELTESRKLWETKRDEGKREWSLQGERREKEKDKNLSEKKGPVRAQRRERNETERRRRSR